MLTARANWGAEPIRDGGRLAAFRGDEAHKPGRPAETQFEALICKQTKRRKAIETQRGQMRGLQNLSGVLFSSALSNHVALPCL